MLPDEAVAPDPSTQDLTEDVGPVQFEPELVAIAPDDSEVLVSWDQQMDVLAEERAGVLSSDKPDSHPCVHN